MTQSALRIISIFLICAAATPVVAGPRGGGHFGGSVHFSAGTGPIAAPHIASPQLATPHFSAPSFAPRLSAPRFSAPLMVPHSARNTRIPLTTPLAPQPFARPAHLPQSHMIVGRIGSAPLLGPVRHGITGVYESGAGPGYAASDSSAELISGLCAGQTAGVTDGRINEIAQIVEPDEGQRAALEELKTATAKAADVLKAACPSDLPSTPTGRIEAVHVRLSAMLEAVRTVRAPLAKFYALLNDEQKARFNALPSGEDQNEPERRRNLSVLCSERAWGISSVPIWRMELAVRPDEVQRASLRALQGAVAQAGELLKTDCPTYRTITPVVRIDGHGAAARRHAARNQYRATCSAKTLWLTH